MIAVQQQGKPTLCTNVLPASAVTIYTPNAKSSALLTSVSACNVTGTAATVTLWIERGGVPYRIWGGLSVAANTTALLVDHVIPIRPGELLRASGGTASAIELLAVVSEAAQQA